MPCRATLAQLISATHAKAIAPASLEATQIATGITTDSRCIQPGEVFVALRGEKFDGHDFVVKALEQGAIAAIVDTQYPLSDAALPLLQVENTLQAYQAIGRWWRDQFTIPVIGVTGSVGKTTTKELIAAVLGQKGKVLKSQANFNNEIGVPKTLLELGPEHDFAVIEMAMRGKGQIAELTQTARPEIGVITNVGTAHIGLLGSEAAIAAAKCELLVEMSASGTAILNYDNPLLMETATHCWQGKTIRYGLTGGDIYGEMVGTDRIRVGNQEFPLPLAGEHNALNYLAALAVAKVLGIDWSILAAGLPVELPGGRAKRYELPHDIVLLDETYNAGLESMLASLKLLAQTPGTRRIAVLGTMKELGDRSPEFHERVGTSVRELNLDGLLILADPAEAAALKQGAAPLAAETFEDQAQVVARLKELMQPGDRLLFKASRAVGLDRVVEQLRTP
ncbi:MAG TPA: UDP-N-acetylmuramoyl-tripeptide--D-alanyl-D-alanine ligase [Leptolyngbyaceae cyanobacterium M33_DOE_097]|uniref:UDP-N-acetylmuramoyl-tripeptide--D-alanyl-D-alanine ligase n=1 Tax=Oscillatoriales cyanobacterium SpSt-418 TaxID=2282169 RepID=A0A7C3PM57_9CYAN|nr:UDP-N-acetylmuramoyl-tripeptide--D-alanyl-D-alanine ligase [Leptolyngbyaceae cyanobacterium M33_DOE_097]